MDEEDDDFDIPEGPGVGGGGWSCANCGAKEFREELNGEKSCTQNGTLFFEVGRQKSVFFSKKVVV